MNSKEKAKELISKFRPYTKIIVADAEYIEDTKICALIAVNNIIEELDELLEGDERPSAGVYYLWEYYKEVKQEIELL